MNILNDICRTTDISCIASISSIIGVLFSFIAAIQAWRALRAASEARDAVIVRSLADDLQLAFARGEQLVEFLQQSRYSEARLRVNDLTWSLSELPHRRSPHLSDEHKRALHTSCLQLQTIVEVLIKNEASQDRIDKEQIINVARRITIKLCEILGDVKSAIEQGEKP